MSLGITATNLANISYGSYLLSNNETAQQYAVSESDLAENLYGVSNLTNALSSLGATANNDGIINVDEYAKNSYLASQTSVYDITSGSVDIGSISGSLSSYAKYSYTAQSLGLTIGSIDLYGVLNASDYAQNAYATYALNTSYSSSSLTDTYDDYLSGSTYSIGSLLDSAA